MSIVRGFPSGSALKNSPVMQETQQMQVRSLGWGEPLEEGMATHSSILPGESHGQRSLAAYSPWGCKESDTTGTIEHAHRHICNQGSSRWGALHVPTVQCPGSFVRCKC